MFSKLYYNKQKLFYVFTGTCLVTYYYKKPINNFLLQKYNNISNHISLIGYCFPPTFLSVIYLGLAVRNGSCIIKEFFFELKNVNNYYIFIKKSYGYLILYQILFIIGVCIPMFSSGFFLTMSYKIYQEMKQKTNQ
jgi:hypothetical protein